MLDLTRTPAVGARQGKGALDQIEGIELDTQTGARGRRVFHLQIPVERIGQIFGQRFGAVAHFTRRARRGRHGTGRAGEFHDHAIRRIRGEIGGAAETGDPDHFATGISDVGRAAAGRAIGIEDQDFGILRIALAQQGRLAGPVEEEELPRIGPLVPAGQFCGAVIAQQPVPQRVGLQGGDRTGEKHGGQYGNKKSRHPGTLILPQEGKFGAGPEIPQVMYCPPFAVRVEPVMKAAASEHRKATRAPISSASPRRPAGMPDTIFSRTASGTAETISVAI